MKNKRMDRVRNDPLLRVYMEAYYLSLGKPDNATIDNMRLMVAYKRLWSYVEEYTTSQNKTNGPGFSIRKYGALLSQAAIQTADLNIMESAVDAIQRAYIRDIELHGIMKGI